MGTARFSQNPIAVVGVYLSAPQPGVGQPFVWCEAEKELKAADIYRVHHTGLDGTSMPSYHDTISPADSWGLVHYIRTLFLDIEAD